VMVATGSPNQAIAVTCSLQALERLLDRWPMIDSTLYKHARHACVLAIEGTIDSRSARKAFTRAAREAGILVENK